MCKGFSSSLIGPALQWYTNLLNNSICSFTQLTNMFIEQFAISRKPQRDSQYLNTIIQGKKESLTNYIDWFNKENVSITNLNTKTIIKAFKNGLHYDLDLCKELTKFPYKNFVDVLAKAWAQIIWDKDKEYIISMGLPVKPGQESLNYLNIHESRTLRQPRRMSERTYEPYATRCR